MMRFWKARSEIVSLWKQIPREHIKELADSDPFTKEMIEAIREKDVLTTRNMLRKALDELT